MLLAAGELGTDRMAMREIGAFNNPPVQCRTIMELLFVLLKDSKNLRRPVGWEVIKKQLLNTGTRLNMNGLDLSNLSQNQLDCLQEAAAMGDLAPISSCCEKTRIFMTATLNYVNLKTMQEGN